MDDKLRFLLTTVVAAKMKSCWAMSVDVFAEWKYDNYTCNFRLEKQHPGLLLFGHEGKEIPVMCAATKNASMDAPVLMQAFKMMEDLGITERGVNEDGNPYFLYTILDRHISIIGRLFLRYINDPTTCWGTGLIAPYGAEFYQFHYDKHQNGAFKTSFAHEKSKFSLKIRIHDLLPEMLPVDILIVAQGAILNPFMNSAYTEAALAQRGFNPFNRNPLNVPVILRTATAIIQQERDIVLHSQGTNNPPATPPPPTQHDLLTTGYGRLAGGAAAADELQQSAARLNIPNLQQAAS